MKTTHPVPERANPSELVAFEAAFPCHTAQKEADGLRHGLCNWAVMRPAILLASAVALLLAACGGKVEGPNCTAVGCSEPPDVILDPAPRPSPASSASASPAPSPTLDCPPPYMLETDDGRCVWSCSEGTEPARDRQECVCSERKTEVGQDTFGRRVCK